MRYRSGLYHFGHTSLSRRATCHPLLREVATEALRTSMMDFSFVCGFRGMLAQNLAFRKKHSTKQWPDSDHNHLADERDVEEGFARYVGQPFSLAMDLAPFLEGRIRWDLPGEIRWLNGWVMGVGMRMVEDAGFYLQSGVDWDMDGDQKEHTLIDAPHIGLRRFT